MVTGGPCPPPVLLFHTDTVVMTMSQFGWGKKKKKDIFFLRMMSTKVESYLGIFPSSAGDVGNICQGISLKRLKSRGRELCEDSIRELILQNVRLTLLQSVADHFTAQL